MLGRRTTDVGGGFWEGYGIKREACIHAGLELVSDAMVRYLHVGLHGGVVRGFAGVYV
jgi:hypothetical protein